ncbi:hypothetical protein SAMN05444920_11090 [Nonomuraea solani]|uniref:Uncharacterized protein n=1 Tax=Nonomuraea solani TaxID=1144553 RepID=A0A1H6EHK1_9ACTN|nr:hypothetical protein SAMN05444920_11090 [Nonomuraea solani]
MVPERRISGGRGLQRGPLLGVERQEGHPRQRAPARSASSQTQIIDQSNRPIVAAPMAAAGLKAPPEMPPTANAPAATDELRDVAAHDEPPHVLTPGTAMLKRRHPHRATGPPSRERYGSLRTGGAGD